MIYLVAGSAHNIKPPEVGSISNCALQSIPLPVPISSSMAERHIDYRTDITFKQPTRKHKERDKTKKQLSRMHAALEA